MLLSWERYVSLDVYVLSSENEKMAAQTTEKSSETSKFCRSARGGWKLTVKGTVGLWDTGLHFGGVARYLALESPLCLQISQELLKNDPFRSTTQQKKSRLRTYARTLAIPTSYYFNSRTLLAVSSSSFFLNVKREK